MAANDGLKVPEAVLPAVTAPPTRTLASIPKPQTKPPEQPAVKDVFREIVETVVFVIVLVFLLKIFVAEAFVIPTGSMAETLLGYQRVVSCPQCEHEFPVNCSQEVDPQDGGKSIRVEACTCPNCRFRVVWYDPGLKDADKPPSWGSGDRVLVAKFPFDKDHLDRLGRPDRFNVVVFKYPDAPQKGYIPMNYIKRLIGLPGETIAIFNGDLYINNSLDYPAANHPRPERAEEFWQKRPTDFTYENDPEAVNAFKAGQFSILRKTPEIMLAMRRLVFDNDHQPADLARKVPPRWQVANKAHWTADNEQAPKVFRTDGSGDAIDWIRYQHLIVDRSNVNPLDPQNIPSPQPQTIKNFMGYNAGEPSHGPVETNWVGDLMLECTVQVETAQGEFILELSEGSERFQARFNLATGACALVRVAAGQEETIATQEKVLPKPGSYALRFANFDDRLTLWVDGQLPFGDGVDYKPAEPNPDHDNNYQPANIGVRGGAKLTVSKVQLWRDTFYTIYPQNRQEPPWLKTMYVEPGHYLCLGDNSTESADSRTWGLVPQRLLLGRALLVYWPPLRAGVIR